MPLIEITNAHLLRAPLPYYYHHHLLHVKDSTRISFETWKSIGKIRDDSLRRVRLPFVIKAVAATIECNKELDISAGLSHPPSPLDVVMLEQQQQQLDEREKLRRLRISKANKGNTPWNKGRKHTPETLRKIKERTRLAMQNPKVMSCQNEVD